MPWYALAFKNGAGERNRTPDRLITNQLLYLLSYASFARCSKNGATGKVANNVDILRRGQASNATNARITNPSRTK